MKFGTNEGTIDRVVRVIVGLSLAGVAWSGAVGAPLVYIAWVVAAIAVITGISGFCAIYALLRMNTKGAVQ